MIRAVLVLSLSLALSASAWAQQLCPGPLTVGQTIDGTASGSAWAGMAGSTVGLRCIVASIDWSGPVPTPVPTAPPFDDPREHCMRGDVGWSWSKPGCPNFGPCVCLPGVPQPTATVPLAPTPRPSPSLGGPSPAGPTATPGPSPDPREHCMRGDVGWSWSKPGCPAFAPCFCVPVGAATATPLPTGTVRPTTTPGPSLSTPKAEAVALWEASGFGLAWRRYLDVERWPLPALIGLPPSRVAERAQRHPAWPRAEEWVSLYVPWTNDGFPAATDRQIAEMDAALGSVRPTGGVIVAEPAVWPWCQNQDAWGGGLYKTVSFTDVVKVPVTDAAGRPVYDRVWNAERHQFERRPRLRDEVRTGERRALKAGDQLLAPLTLEQTRAARIVADRGQTVMVTPYYFGWQDRADDHGAHALLDWTDADVSHVVECWAGWTAAARAQLPTGTRIVAQTANCAGVAPARYPLVTAMAAGVLRASGYPAELQLERCLYPGKTDRGDWLSEADCPALGVARSIVAHGGGKLSFWDHDGLAQLGYLSACLP